MDTRPPTIQHAVEIMKKTITEEQKKLNLAFWRERYGDAYVAQIEATLAAKKK